MLGMRDEEVVIAILAMMCGTAMVVWLVIALSRGRNRKMEIIETALKQNTLDEATKHLLITELTKPSLPIRIIQTVCSPKLLGAAGWIGVFLGLSLLLSDDRHAFQAGLPIAFISFAVLTLPFALRELETRKRGRPPVPAPRDMR